MPNGSPRARCLLLVPRGHDAPPDLLEGLARRRVRVREVNDAPSVMVALADSGAARPKVVVIVHPAAQGAAEALVAAVRRYHADVVVWRYEPGLRPALSAWPADETGQPLQTDPQPVPYPFAAAEPPMPSEPQPPAGVATVEADGVNPAPAGLDDDDLEPPLLSEEELAMLLGDDEPDLENEKDHA